MANAALAQRIQCVLREYRAGTASRQSLISALDLNGNALEGVSRLQLDELRDLIYRLEVCWCADEFPEFESCEGVADRVQEWLEALIPPVPPSLRP